MNLDGKDVVKYVESDARFKPEVDAFYKSLNLLPDYDYSKFYSNHNPRPGVVEQGDGIDDLKIINLPRPETKDAPCMVFSNACDIDTANQRSFAAKIVYAPILRLEKYIELLKRNGKYSDQHIKDIKNQRIGQIFYLPEGSGLSYEAIVFLGSICSSDNDSIDRESLDNTRLFRLSSYGWYIFLSKLSLFFVRLSEDAVQLRFQPPGSTT